MEYNYKVYCKAGNVELNEKEAFDIYNNGKYVCTSTAVWQPHYIGNQSQHIYFTKVLTVKGIARRGRYYTLTAAQVNSVLGGKYLLEA